MLTAQILKKNSRKQKPLTKLSEWHTVPEGNVINPYRPFLGTDGLYYRILYPKKIIPYTNCYSYAMGWTTSGKFGIDYYPGWLSGRRVSIESLRELVQSDLKSVGRHENDFIEEVPKHLPKIPEGYWIKALYCELLGKESVHFMIKDSLSGRWLHKTGWDTAPKVVTKIIEYRTERQLLFEAENLKKYSAEEIEEAMKSIFKSDFSGIVPTVVGVETRDNADFETVSKNGLLLTYKTLWAMNVSY